MIIICIILQRIRKGIEKPLLNSEKSSAYKSISRKRTAKERTARKMGIGRRWSTTSIAERVSRYEAHANVTVEYALRF